MVSRLNTLKDCPVGAETALPIRLESRISMDLRSSSRLGASEVLQFSTKLLNSKRDCRKFGGYEGQLIVWLSMRK